MIDFQKEIVFASENSSESRMIAYKESKGTIRRIAPRLYTTNMVDSPENIVRRNLIDILGWRFPGCVISHKSASSLRPTAKGNLYLTYNFTRRVTDFPGLVLNVLKGPEHLAGDVRLGRAEVYASSEERWMLEVLQPARRGKNGESKGLSKAEVETRLDAMIRVGGEQRINLFRDNARMISEQLGLEEEFAVLNSIVSALLNTHSPSVLSTTEGFARAGGSPLDPTRIPVFEALYDELNGRYFPDMRDENNQEGAFRMFSFFESYCLSLKKVDS